jgi:hypothetical protein
MEFLPTRRIQLELEAMGALGIRFRDPSSAIPLFARCLSAVRLRLPLGKDISHYLYILVCVVFFTRLCDNEHYIFIDPPQPPPQVSNISLPDLARPVFGTLTIFHTTGVIMNVFLLDPPRRLLSAFVWISSSNTIGESIPPEK